MFAQLEKFILEMGTDFAFLARQKHFVLDGKDYFMDLLFFYRTLRRLVLIELKLGEIELMELDNGSIHVAQYLTKVPPKEVLKKKLLQAIANAKEQLEQRKE